MIDTFWHQYTHKNKNSFTQSDNNVTLPVKSGCFCSNCPQVSLNKTRYMISKKEMKMNRSRKFNWFGWNFFFPSINVTDSSTQSEYFFFTANPIYLIQQFLSRWFSPIFTIAAMVKFSFSFDLSNFIHSFIQHTTFSQRRDIHAHMGFFLLVSFFLFLIQK